MKTKATVTKGKSYQPSFDVSYAEILAEVQKLQQMLDGNIQTEKKQRKKRTLKAKVEDTQTQPVMGEVQQHEDEIEEPKHETEAISQSSAETKTSKNRYKVSNLDEIREKISEVKELIQDADPEAAAVVAAETAEPEAKIFQTTKDVVEENADASINPQSAQTIDDTQDDKPTSSKQKQASDDVDSDLLPPKGLKADAQSDLDSYFMDGKEESPKSAAPVGLAEERHAAQLAKHGVTDEKQIVKANLEHDKSGPEWGGSVNLEEDPSLDHPQP